MEQAAAILTSKEVEQQDAAIEVSNLSKSFGENEVLKDFSLSLRKGENLVVMGRSGSGKSVFIKCLVGLLKPDAGKIVVSGNDISSLKQEELDNVRQKIGFLFQSSALYDSMTVRENFLFPLRNRKDISPQEADKRVKEVLQSIGLPKVENAMPADLSGGMRKRVGLGRCLMVQPEILMYDEPTTGLDAITSAEISQLIVDVQKQYNTSSIIITHDKLCARLTANRVIILSEGKTYAEGTFDEITNVQDDFIRAFFNE